MQESIEDKEKWNLLASVADLYYNSDMTQNEIADTFFVSRSKISRMIKEARELGIVEITIREPWERNHTLEEQIIEKFKVDRVIVARLGEKEEIIPIEKLGEIGAYYLSANLRNRAVLGISWGNTVYQTVNAIQSNKNISLTVVPIMGAANLNTPERNILELSKQFAAVFGGEYKYIVAPLFVTNKELKESLIQEPDVKEALELAKNADMVLTSVGSIVYKSWSGYLSLKSMENLEKKGAIGHIGGHFYNLEGKEVAAGLSDRTIGITLEDMKQIKDVVCIAGRKEKVEAIYGALKGGIINTLITDEIAAQEIVTMI